MFASDANGPRSMAVHQLSHHDHLPTAFYPIGFVRVRTSILPRPFDRMNFFNPKLAVVDNRFSNPRDLAGPSKRANRYTPQPYNLADLNHIDMTANERNFLTSVRMICGLLTVTAALLLKFRFTSGETGSNRLDSFWDATDTTVPGSNVRLEEDSLNLDSWPNLLGYLTEASDIAGSTSPANLAETYPDSSNPLLEQNHVAIPLGICVFAICVFILATSTYGYNHTHRQLADGRAFAGSWRYARCRRSCARKL